MLERIKTGIPGFDNIIQGGLIPNSVNLLSGGTGTGKTIFCLQFLINGAKQFNEKGIYLSFEETEEDLKADVKELGLNFDGIANKLKVIYVPIYSITDFIAMLNEEVFSFKPKRVVIDSVSALAMPMEGDFERRKQIFKVRETLKVLNCTSVLTSEIPSESSAVSEYGGSFSRYGLEEFLCDSVITLHYAGIGGESDRAIRVVKMRRTDHIRGPVPMEIGKMGISVSKLKHKY